MIRLENVSKFYGSGPKAWPVLDQISLYIPKGSIFGIIGPSGAGKSTLLRIFNQLTSIDSGELWLKERPLHLLDLKARRALRQSIGMVFQHFNLLSSRTVYENIHLALELGDQKHPEAEAADRSYLEHLLELTELSKLRDHYPAQLSGGQQQRVAIARSLVCKPELLLCDEATSALDPETSQSILALLKKVQTEFKLTIVLISHDLNVIKSICDQVALLEQGRCTEVSEVYRFFLAPQSKTAQAWVYNHFGVEIPEKLQLSNTITQQVLLRLSYADRPAGEAIISQLVKTHPVEINILRGNIETIQGHTIGILVVSLIGEATAREQALAFLALRHVHVEVLSYVA